MASDANSAALESAGLAAETGGAHQGAGLGDGAGPRVALDRQRRQFDGLSGGHGEVVGPFNVVADDGHRAGLEPAGSVDVIDDGGGAAAVHAVVGADPLVGTVPGVVPPPEVAKTVVAASEPRLPRTVTVVEMGAPVGLLNESMVRAKSWLPTLGTVTARETVNPARVSAAVFTVRPPFVRLRLSAAGGDVGPHHLEPVHAVEDVVGALDQLAGAEMSDLYRKDVVVGRNQVGRGGERRGIQQHAHRVALLVSHDQVGQSVPVEVPDGDRVRSFAPGTARPAGGEGSVAVAPECRQSRW